MKNGSSTQYVLIPKHIFDRFFKEIKIGKKRISGIINEAAIKENIKSKRDSIESTEKPAKRKRPNQESSSSEETSESSFSDSEESN